MTTCFIYCCGCKKKVYANLVKGNIVYSHRKDLKNLNFYLCECGLFVGCHKNSDHNYIQPLGCIATKEIKNARQHIHKLLDPLWRNKKKGKRKKRTKLYKYLTNKLGYQYHTAEIKTIKEARKIYKIIQQLIKNNGSNKR